jgi:hypothetical protein
MKSIIAKLAGWGQFFVVCVDQTLQAHGVPSTVHQWLLILGSAGVLFVAHYASSTDGTK